MKSSSVISYLVLFLVAITIGIFSYYNVWNGDDIKYAYNFEKLYSEHNYVEIQSFTDIIQSQNAHYFAMNGRYIAHILVQAFCGIWGQTAFSIVNGIFYVLFFLILCKLCNVKLTNYSGVISIVIIALLSFQTKMVPSCQISYIWMYTFSMSYLYVFLSNPRKTFWMSVIMGLIAIIIGNGQESLNLGICTALIIYWICNHKKMSILQYCLMVGFGIGTLIICMSPASQGRAEGSFDFSMVEIFKTFIYLLIYLRATYFLLAVVLYKKLHYKEKFSTIYRDNCFYWNVWFTLIIFNLIIGFGSNRSAFGIELISIIIGFRLLPKRKLTRAFNCLLALILFLIYYYQSIVTIRTKQFFNSIENKYTESKDGVVYEDRDYSSPLLFHTNFTRIIFPHGTEGPRDYYISMLKLYFQSKYPDKPEIIILPTMLKDIKDKEVENLIVKLCDGFWLVVQSKDHPKEFEILREINLPGFHKIIEPKTVEFESDYVLSETDHWRARVIREYNYNVMHLNSFNIKIKQ